MPKMKLFYVVTDSGHLPDNAVEYVEGPFNSWSKALDVKRALAQKSWSNYELSIVTHEIEVEK